VIDIRDLRYAWPGEGVDVLDIGHLEVADGERLFLHGPSGCGKSTLLGLMSGVLVARAGQVRCAGVDWRALAGGARDARRADLIGVIFQQFNLLPYLSLLDNVLLPARLSRARAARCGADVQAAARALLERVALPATLWTRRADALSVGQQQRVAAARALLGRPALVIADEPTSALDAALRDDFMGLLLEACHDAGSTLVFVSHDHRLADRFDRCVALPAVNRAARPVAA
jgi:putative ABC transport system ATP-binding protein